MFENFRRIRPEQLEASNLPEHSSTYLLQRDIEQSDKIHYPMLTQRTKAQHRKVHANTIITSSEQADALVYNIAGIVRDSAISPLCPSIWAFMSSILALISPISSFKS